MLQDDTRMVGRSSRPRLATIALPFVAFGVAAGIVLNLLLRGLKSPDLASVVSVVLVLLLSEVAALWWIRAGAFPGTKTSLYVILVLWGGILLAEDVLARTSPLETAFEGRFLPAVYGEIAIWIIALLASILLAAPALLGQTRFFSRDGRWLSLFGILSVLSVIYSSRPLYSLAWAFKLCLVIWLLQLCRPALSSPNDVRAFLRVSLWVFAVVGVAALAQAIMDPTGAFAASRLQGYTGSTNVSEKGGLLLLLAIILYSVESRGWMIPFAALGGSVLLLGGGKASIAAALVAGVVFFLVRKKAGAAFIFAAALAAAGLLVVLVPGLAYFQQYAESGMFTTLSGRTGLWLASVRPIMESPIWGHGYVTSKFVSIDVAEVTFEAGHMHNAFLDVLYNNGAIGLIVILAMNVQIIRNLARTLRVKATREVYCLGAGLLALYVDIFLDGMFRSSFGGRPLTFFLLFLALVVLSEKLSATPSPSPAQEEHPAQL